MVAAGEVLHAADADGYKTGCKDWGMPGGMWKERVRKGGGKKKA